VGVTVVASIKWNDHRNQAGILR